MSTPRVWLITGTSSGLGLAIARHVLSQGDIAVATLRKPEMLHELVAGHPKERLLVLKLDVTIHQDILDAFKKTKEVFGRIDVVVSNAGFLSMNVIENTPGEVARNLFEVNFWGSVHVLQEAVRFMRDENAPGTGGRIIQISSMWEYIGVPSAGFYSATKHAIGGIMKSLAKEIDPAWNIKLTNITLGLFDTNVFHTAVKNPVNTAYANPELPTGKLRKAVTQYISGGSDPLLEVKGDPAKAAAAIYRLSEVSKPPLQIPLGAVEIARGAAKDLLKEVDEWASWSVGLDKDDFQK